jgi:predicted DNA-binding protein (UPF0251 family)
MVRPKNCRLIGSSPNVNYFKPGGIPLWELVEINLTLDELESLRLADLEGMYHENAAQEMGVSRATFGRILELARRKVSDALVHGKALRIEGGEIQIMSKRVFQCKECTHQWEVAYGVTRPKGCPQCGSSNIQRINPGSGGEHGRGCGRKRRKQSRCGNRTSQTQANE